MNNYEIVVGLEIHAHLKTESKMFCRCGTGPKGVNYEASVKDEPNLRICPVCTGQPGTLPVPNKKAIEDTILLGFALGSTIPETFNFERKNYYYPDLPKAYQITSATNPPVVGGGLEIETKEGLKFVELDHIHLEEDAGKLTHDKSKEFSLVDLNRAGTPLLEIITKPVLSSGEDAAEFMKSLQGILRYLNISDADMEKGQMRCDANISVREKGQTALGAKVEVKNINSFKMVSRAIAYEAERQIEVLENGSEVSQETRGWDDNKGKTTAQRSKEFANDYRYFPEPDIPPIRIGQGTLFDLDEIKKRLPELPKEKKSRFVVEYGLSDHEARMLTQNVDVSEFFEKIIESTPQLKIDTAIQNKIGKLTATLLITEILPKVDDIQLIKTNPQDIASLVSLILDEKISQKIAKEIIPSMLERGEKPERIIESKGLIQESDPGKIMEIVKRVLSENKSQVESYKSGNVKIFGFFVGQVMKESQGKANPGLVNEILRKELSK